MTNCRRLSSGAKIFENIPSSNEEGIDKNSTAMETSGFDDPGLGPSSSVTRDTEDLEDLGLGTQSVACGVQ